MGYIDFRDKFKKTREQHNVMAIVGNGFDLQVLSDFGSRSDTRYASFYHYLQFRNFDPANHLFRKMGELLAAGAPNWSDIEGAIIPALRDGAVHESVLREDLRNVQLEFAKFLDEVVTPELLTELGNASASQKWALRTFTEFLGDIRDPAEYGKMALPRRLDIGDLFNFKFINFNYTSLLDDYAYLDQTQFDWRVPSEPVSYTHLTLPTILRV